LRPNFETTLIASAVGGEIDILIQSGKFPHTQSLGIGNLEAAISLKKYLYENSSVDSIFFFGSCGVYPWASFQSETMVSVSHATHLEISSALGQSKQIQTKSISLFSKALPLGLPLAVCNAPSTLTLLEMDKPPNENWNSLEIENLELFGIARVCESMIKHLSAFLAITNVVGQNGSKDWQKNWRKCSSQLQNDFLEVIS
jgi:hypothetical protein